MTHQEITLAAFAIIRAVFRQSSSVSGSFGRQPAAWGGIDGKSPSKSWVRILTQAWLYIMPLKHTKTVKMPKDEHIIE